MDLREIKKQIPEKLSEIVTIKGPGIKPNGKLAIGFGVSEKVGEEIGNLTKGTALVVTDKTIINLGLHEGIIHSLKIKGIDYEIFDEVEPEPHINTAEEIQKIIKSRNYGVVVGLGGGSCLDMAKIASLLATNHDDIDTYLNGGTFIEKGLPSILLPTTSGTGSEVSPYVVLSTDQKKVFFSSPYAYAEVALVDPLLTATTPPKVTASTGLDALTHGVEGVIGKMNPYTQALSSRCVELVFNYLPRAYQDGMDLEARYYMSFASVLGMLAYSQGGGLYAHSISYLLTLYNGLPHGVGCGFSLPYTMMYNLEHIEEIIDIFSMPIIRSKANTSEQRVEVIKAFHKLSQELGMPENLKELGVDNKSLEQLAIDLVDKYYRDRNPRKMTKDDAIILVRNMWEGKLV
jgi:alcohol dehydrogenase